MNKYIDFEQALVVDTAAGAVQKPLTARIDTRWDWLEDGSKSGSLLVGFNILDKKVGTGSNYITLFGNIAEGTLYGVEIAIEKTTNNLVFFLGDGSGYIRQDTPIPAFQENRWYWLEVIKNGTTLRYRLNTLPLTGTVNTINTTSATGFKTTQPFTIGTGYLADVASHVPTHKLAICKLVGFRDSEIDRWGGSTDTADSDTMCNLGNFIPPRRHPFVCAHYALQDTPEGAKLMDSVSQYNHAKEQDFYPIGRNGTGWASGFAGGLPNWAFAGGEGEAAGDTLTGTVSRDSTLVIGRTYKIFYDIVTITGGWAFYPLMDGGAISTVTNAPGSYTLTGTPTSPTLGDRLYFWLDSAGVGSVKIKNLKVRSLSHGVLDNVPLELTGSGYATGNHKIDIATRATVTPSSSEIIKALQIKATYSTELFQSIPISSHLTGIGTGNFGLLYAFDNQVIGTDNRMLYFRSNGLHLTVYKNRIEGFPHVAESGADYFTYNVPGGMFKGINSIYVQRTGLMTYELYVNGFRVLTYTQPSGTPGSLSGLHTFNLPSYSDNKEYDGIVLGVVAGTLTSREVLNLHANSRLANPPTLTNWKCYYRLGNVVDGNEVPDLTGLNGDLALTNFSADQLNPAHADYAVRNLSYLRSL